MFLFVLFFIFLFYFGTFVVEKLHVFEMLHCTCDSSPCQPAADNKQQRFVCLFSRFIGRSVCLLLLHWKTTEEETAARFKRWRRAAVAALPLVKPVSRSGFWLLLFVHDTVMILRLILSWCCKNSGIMRWWYCSNVGMILWGHSEDTVCDCTYTWMILGWHCDDTVRILWWCYNGVVESYCNLGHFDNTFMTQWGCCD